jgi:hypothetical protein
MKVLREEGITMMTQRIEEVLDRVQRHVCEINLNHDGKLTADVNAKLYELENWIAVKRGHPDKAFRLTHGNKDVYGALLVARYTYEVKEGNGDRIVIKYCWNDTEVELGIWPERPLLNRDVIASFVHPQNAEQDRALFDEDGTQVEVTDLRTGRYHVFKKNDLIDVIYRHDQAFFKPGEDLTDRVRRKFELETEWSFLRSSTDVKIATEAKATVEYRMEMGRLNYLEWRKKWLPVIWEQTESDYPETQLEEQTSLRGPWKFELMDGAQIAVREFTQGDEYRLIQIAEATLVYQGREYQINWRTGHWGEALTNSARSANISTRWRARLEAQIMTEDTDDLDKWQVETVIQVRTFFPTETRELERYPNQKG